MTRSTAHRTPGRRRLYFDSLDEDEPPEWLVRVLARHLYRIEEHIGTKVVRSGRTVAAPLGCGSFGCVFRLEDGRVLKLTSDEAEGPVTEWVRQKQEDGTKIGSWSVLAGTTRIDQVFRLGRRVRVYGEDIDPSWIYGIVREEVGCAGEGVSVALRSAADLYAGGWDTYCEASDDPTPAGRIIGRAMAQVGLRSIRRCGSQGRRLAGILEASWECGVPLMDVHSNNLAVRLKNGPGGARKGQVVVFDFGGNPSVRVHGETCWSELTSVMRDLTEIARAVPVLSAR